ncbi:MFS transporter [Gilliamella apicola]|uniref:MFS transporter n=1 Tax=Gilliamella apicola TaxID=1196095 RepID=UPI0011B3FFF7|nr:MFS transporter [Gilliamella apicola]
MGLFQAIYALGMTLSPTIVGVISLQSSMIIAYFSLAGIAIIAATLSIIYWLKFKSDIC